MVGRPTPRRGSTRSLSNRLNTSDHVSSAATRKFAASACRARSAASGTRLGNEAVVEVDPRVADKGFADGQALRRLERARLAAAKAEGPCARDVGRERHERGAVVHQRRERRADPVPFEHRKFRRVQPRALAIAEDVRQREDLRLAGREELLHRELGRCVQPGLVRRPVGPDEAGAKPVQMGLVAGRGLEGGRIDLDEAFGVEPATRRRGDPRARQQSRPSRRVTLRTPEGRGERRTQGAPQVCGRIANDLAFAAEISISAPKAPGRRLENERPFAHQAARPVS